MCVTNRTRRIETKPNTIYHLFVVARKEKITLQMSHDTENGASKQRATIKLCAVAVFVVHSSSAAVFNEKNRYAKTLATVVLRNVTTATPTKTNLRIDNNHYTELNVTVRRVL